jgi:AmiR/NasT family two-component response regulator
LQALVDNLQQALESRDIIGQAKGIIMERQRCTADEAFDILRWTSQNRHVKLRDLARQVTETGTWDQIAPEAAATDSTARPETPPS